LLWFLLLISPFPTNPSTGQIIYRTAQDNYEIKILPESKASVLGWVALTTDLNGDGLSDLIFAAPYHGGEDIYGAVYLVWGSDRFPSRLITDLREEDADITIYGPNSWSLLGIHLAAGDVNGDGIQDLGISAWSGPSLKTGSAGHLVQRSGRG